MNPRSRRLIVLLVVSVLVIAAVVALSGDRASSGSSSAPEPSVTTTEPQRDYVDTLQKSIDDAVALREQQERDFLKAVEYVQAVEAEQQRQAEAAAAAEAEHQRQAAAAKAAAAEKAQQEAAKPAPAPKSAPASPAPAARSTSGNCGGWEGLISSHFSDVGTACRVMMCESGGNPHAQNPSGASGLFQVMPEWASRYQQVTGVPYYDGRFNPNASTAFAAYLVREAGWASQFSCY